MVNDVNQFHDVVMTDAEACLGELERHDDNLPAGFRSGHLPPAGEVVLRLLAIGERLRQHVAEVSQRLDFTPQQGMLVDRLTQPKTMGQIADDLGCDKSNVTGLISRLEARGLVTRLTDEHDRRIKWLVLTDAGRDAQRALRSSIIDQAEALLGGLDNADRTAFLSYLRHASTTLLDHAKGPCGAAADAYLAPTGHQAELGPMVEQCLGGDDDRSAIDRHAGLPRG
jgi:DNA-binding MarR family transcriptional regulator